MYLLLNGTKIGKGDYEELKKMYYNENFVYDRKLPEFNMWAADRIHEIGSTRGKPFTQTELNARAKSYDNGHGYEYASLTQMMKYPYSYDISGMSSASYTPAATKLNHSSPDNSTIEKQERYNPVTGQHEVHYFHRNISYDMTEFERRVRAEQELELLKADGVQSVDTIIANTKKLSTKHKLLIKRRRNE